MPAGHKQRRKIAGASQEGVKFLGILPDGLVLLEESDGASVRLEHLNGLGIERGEAAVRGGGDDFEAGGGEDVVGVGELGLLEYITNVSSRRDDQ